MSRGRAARLNNDTNIVLDPLDKELTRRGHVFARYADDFLILVKSAKAAQRVMESVATYVEGKLKLVVNRTKSKCAPLAECEFLGFKISKQGKVKWTEKSVKRYKQKVKEITRRNRGASAKDVIVELRRYVTGWANYFAISHTYREALELDEWMRRRVRLYYWTAPAALAAHPDAKPPRRASRREDKQWKRPGPRRRNLLKLGANPKKVHMATRSRKGYWRMSRNKIVHQCLNNRWLKEQGVPEVREVWIKLHYGDKSRPVSVV